MPERDPIEQYISVLDANTRERVRNLVKPFAGGEPRQPGPPQGLLRRRHTTPATITDSYIGGHPFQPDGDPWPVDAHGNPMNFLAQINFATTPTLAGFPTEGMLQLFIEDNSTYGMTFDHTVGTVGHFCRWYPATRLTEPVTVQPHTSVVLSDDLMSPVMNPSTPVPVEFTLDRMLPQGWEHLNEHIALAPEAFRAMDETNEDHELLAEAIQHGSTIQIGGWPTFVQGPPAVPAGRSADLLVGFASTGPLMWGDVGTANFFGDPSALTRGDTSGIWWEWSCS